MTLAGKSMRVLAGAALAASAIGGALMAGREAASGTTPGERDLFSFVRPLPNSSEADIQHGETVPDRKWRLVFDRHLEVAGEGHAAREAIAREPGEQGAEVQAMLDKYLRYRQQMQPLQAAIDEGRNLDASVKALHALRAAMFSPAERAALFPVEESYENLLLARQAVMDDFTLDEDERHRRLRHIESSVPPDVRLAEEMRSGVVRLTPSPQTEGEDDVYRLAPAQ